MLSCMFSSSAAACNMSISSTLVFHLDLMEEMGQTRGHFACDHPHVCSQGSKNRPLLHTGDRRELMKKLSTTEVFGNGTTWGLLVVTYMYGARASAAIIARTTPDDCPHAETIQLSHLRSPYGSRSTATADMMHHAGLSIHVETGRKDPREELLLQTVS